MPQQKKKEKSRSKSKDTSKQEKSAKKKSSSKSGDKQEKSKVSSKSKSKQPKKKEQVQKIKEEELPKFKEQEELQEDEKLKKTPRETDIAGDLSSIPHITHISSNPLSPKDPPPNQYSRNYQNQSAYPRGINHEYMGNPNPFHQCKLHNKPLTLYCMNNQEPCCYDCSIMGPFNTGLYRVCTLVEAFNQRYSQFNYNIRSSLLPKREQLMAQMVRLQYRLEQVNTASSIIERDIKMEFSNYLSRLKHAQGKKTALLHHDLSIVQQDLRKIDQMVSLMENHANVAGGLPSSAPEAPIYEQQSLGRAGMINSLATFGARGGCNSNQQMLSFLLQFRQLSASVDYSMTKPIKKAIEVNSTDLPRQLAQRRANDQQMSKLKEMLDAKDDVIWQLMQRAKGTQSIQRQLANQEIVQEIQKWVNLCDRQAQYIKQLTGSDNLPNMNQDLINPMLHQHQTPNKKRNGSFISPSAPREQDISAISNGSMPMLIPSELLRDHPQISNAMMVMKQACYQKKQINLQDEFKKKDQEGNGKVTRRQFQNVILQNFVNFQAGMMQILGQILAPQYIDVINYNDFLGLVKNFRNVNKGGGAGLMGGGQLGLFDRAGNTGRSTMVGDGSYYGGGGGGGGVNQSINLGNSLGMVNEAQIKNLFVQQLPQLEYSQIISLLRFMSIKTGQKVNIEEFANRFDYF